MDDFEKNSLRGDRGALEKALEEAGGHIRGNSLKCPFHDDKTPSASIFQKDGVWRFKCHGCAINEDVIGIRARNENKTTGDVLKSMTPPAAKPRVAATPPKVFAGLAALKSAVPNLDAAHVYTNPETGKPDMVVLRLKLPGGKKKFIQCRPEMDGFVMSAPPKPWPIYNRARVAAAEQVVVVEGEKCVEVLQRLGIVATTSPGGAENGKNANWKPLAGKKVVLWPDHDAPDADGIRKGHQHMRNVLAVIEQLDPAPEVYWIDPESFALPAGGDVVDYIAKWGGVTAEKQRDAVTCAMELAEPLGASKGLEQLIEDTISGKRSAIPWPWPALARLSQALLPGTVTAICGDPGSGKSFLMAEAAMYWHEHGHKTAVFMLEEDREYHLNRALAQLDGNSNLTDAKWVKEHPDESRAAYRTHKKKLDAFARCIHAAPDEPATLDTLLGWVRDCCKAGCEVVAIDPITAAETGKERFIEDLKFLAKAKVLVRKSGARLVLTTHPRTGAKGWTDMAGGACYPRFAQNVFWIHRHEQGKPARVFASDGTPFHTTINRSIKLGKTRNGSGAGLELGYIFQGSSLRFAEQGIVAKSDTSPPPPQAGPRAPRVEQLQDPFVEQEVA